MESRNGRGIGIRVCLARQPVLWQVQGRVTPQTPPANLPANPPAVAHQTAPQAIPAPQPSTMTPPPPPGVPGIIASPGAAQAATGGTFQIVRVEVTPRADGKVEIKMYAQGHKFPDLKMVNAPEKIAAQFGTGWQKEQGCLYPNVTDRRCA